MAGKRLNKNEQELIISNWKLLKNGTLSPEKHWTNFINEVFVQSKDTSDLKIFWDSIPLILSKYNAEYIDIANIHDNKDFDSAIKFKNKKSMMFFMLKYS
jgi:hypothetical protein